jgi:hypothetical protein
MSYSERQGWGRLTVRLVKSLGQVVDTIKQEATLDSHSNSFVS